MRSTLVFDKRTGEVARAQTFADQTTGERARSWMRFAHTGEFYGVTGQTIAGIASAAGANVGLHSLVTFAATSAGMELATTRVRRAMYDCKCARRISRLVTS